MALRTSTQVMSAIRSVPGSGAVRGRLTSASASTVPANAVMTSFAAVRPRRAARLVSEADSDMMVFHDWPHSVGAPLRRLSAAVGAPSPRMWPNGGHKARPYGLSNRSAFHSLKAVRDRRRITTWRVKNTPRLSALQNHAVLFRTPNACLRNPLAPAQKLRLHEILRVGDRGRVQGQQAELGK